jgi:hypothetical protein
MADYPENKTDVCILQGAALSIGRLVDFFQVARLTVYRLICRKELTAYKDDNDNKYSR